MSPKSSCCEFKAFQINIEFDSASGFLFCLVFGFNYKANSSYFIHKIRNYHKNNATDDREIENKPTENKTACNFWSFLFAIKYIKLVRNKKKTITKQKCLNVWKKCIDCRCKVWCHKHAQNFEGHFSVNAVAYHSSFSSLSPTLLFHYFSSWYKEHKKNIQ